MSHTLRKIAWFRLTALIVALLVLGATGFLGVRNVFNEWRGAITPMQKSVTAAGGLYGILAIITAVGLILRRRWTGQTAIAWAIAVTYTGTAAVTVYGEAPNPVIATLGAFVMCAAVVAPVVWLTKVGLKQIVSYDEVPSSAKQE